MNRAELLVDALLEWGDEEMPHGAAASGPGPGAAPANAGGGGMSPEGERRLQHILQTCRQRFVEERVAGYSDGGRQFPPISRQEAEALWQRQAARFEQTFRTDPELRQRYHLESEMPDWLKKKISGKKGDDEGGKEDKGKKSDKSDKDKKDEEDEESESPSVASVTGSKSSAEKEKSVGKTKGGEGKVEHTF